MVDDFENTLVRDRWVRILLDFDAEGVWDKEGCACEVRDLPITDGLAQRLLAWSCKYNTENKSWDDVEDDFDYEASTAEGFSIARAVKRELPDWTIVFFDDVAARENRYVPVNRSRYEYEIESTALPVDIGTGDGRNR